MDASHTALRRYVPGPDGATPIVWYEGSGTSDRRWLVRDVQGSAMAVADSSGTVMQINSYDPYGLPASTNLGRFQYVGRPWLAEVGLYYDQARMYSPTLGRFLQTDLNGYNCWLA